MTDVIIKGPNREEKISVWGGEIELLVKVAGSGPAIVYLHPAGPLVWDQFLDRLAENHTVYAPLLPGTTPGDPYAIYKVNNYEELILIYEEAIRKLNLDSPVVIGQSMGGMIACDLAAAYPSMFKRVVALAPAGMWREEYPVAIADLYRASPEELPAMLFNDPNSPGARTMMALPSDPEDIPGAIAYFVWGLGCSSKFIWPIPERGLKRRLHRIKAPSLILWGEQDKVMPAAYIEDFANGIKDCRTSVFENCGHVLQVDRLEETVSAVCDFIG